MRKPSKKTLKKKADKLFSEKIRSLNKCQLKGKDHILCSSVFQCAHIVGRANHRLRWDFNNALCICSGHHMWYTAHPWEWNELIKEYYPIKYKYVNQHRNEVWDKDIEEVLRHLI